MVRTLYGSSERAGCAQRRRVGGGGLRLGVLLAALAGSVSPVFAQTEIIHTWAGGGPAPGAVADAVSVGSPNSVANDDLGNYYIASSETDLVYRVDSAGLLTVFAGGGTRQGAAADGQPATEAKLNGPSHIVWYLGAVYVVEGGRVRLINTQGVMWTVAGGGTIPFTNGMRAVDLEFDGDCPSGLAISYSGDVYFTDLCDNTIKRIDVLGLLTRVAGVAAVPGSLSGDGGRASLASFRRPLELAIDLDTGDLAVLDQTYSQETGRVRRISAGSDGMVTGDSDETIVSVTDGGCCEVGPVNDGLLALEADMRGLTAIGWYDGAIVVGQTYEGPGFLWRINGNGTLRLLAGRISGLPRFVDRSSPRPSTGVGFGVFAGIALSQNFEILIADSGFHGVGRIPEDEIYRIAGNGDASLSGDGGLASSAQLYLPSAIQFDAAGDAFIIDQDRSRLRVVDAATGAIESVVPIMPSGAPFRPQAIAIHPTSGLVYFANNDEQIHSFDPGTGDVVVVAGTGIRTCSLDCEGGDPDDDLGDLGLAVGATFNGIVSLAFDAAGDLFLADVGNHLVRRIRTNGFIITVAGTGVGGFNGDGLAATAQLMSPSAVAVGLGGALNIADSGNRRIRQVLDTAIVNTGIQTLVTGYDASGLAADGSGRVFFTGPSEHDVRVWEAGTVSSYVSDSALSGFAGDGGLAVDALVLGPRGLALHGGDLYVADSGNHRIRNVYLPEPGAGALGAAALVVLAALARSRPPS